VERERVREILCWTSMFQAEAYAVGTDKSMKTAPSAFFCLPNDSCVLAALSTELRGCTEEADAGGESTRAVAREGGCTRRPMQASAA